MSANNAFVIDVALSNESLNPSPSLSANNPFPFVPFSNKYPVNVASDPMSDQLPSVINAR